jgi:cellulose synthase/poly-beta-1,6-N-acetylglucosamine synthase-like glycosyltransferase
MVILFCVCLALLAYVYLAYPALAAALAARFGRPVRRGEALPRVTIIVTAYNEAKCIRAKLDNLAALDYPATLVDILVASDGSSDATDAIAAAYDPSRVRVLHVAGRLGKTACQNAAAAVAIGEILMFTDATTRLQSAALKRLVENFADADVGCVAGRLDYVSDINNVTGLGGELYWSYEMRLRAAESSLGSLIGVSGCLYAVRRSAYRPIDPELISDFVVAMKMREQGLRTVLAPAAVCFEATLDRGSRELSMRVRVAIRSLNALIREYRFLNPVKYGCFAWQLWSHKVLRYAAPLLWLGALAANIALVRHTPVVEHLPAFVIIAPYLVIPPFSVMHPYWAMLSAQVALIALGALGFWLQGTRRELGLFARPYYFLLTNVASFIATLRYLQGERMITWEPIR